MTERRRQIQRGTVVLMGIAMVVACAATFGKRPSRALVKQPSDFVRAISAEFLRADSVGGGFRMAKYVAGMFWTCHEVKMVDGRAFSGLPVYQSPADRIETGTQEVVNVDVKIE